MSTKEIKPEEECPRKVLYSHLKNPDTVLLCANLEDLRSALHSGKCCTPHILLTLVIEVQMRTYGADL